VVAVLLERGSAQPVVQKIWNNLPLEKGEKCRRATRSTSGAAAGRAQLLHLHGLAHHAAVQRGRAVDGDEAAGGLSPEQIGIFARLYR
jgi:carbonic anhydrase